MYLEEQSKRGTEKGIALSISCLILAYQLEYAFRNYCFSKCFTVHKQFSHHCLLSLTVYILSFQICISQ